MDQVFSRYHYMVTRQMYNKSFEETLKEKPFLIKDGFYYKHITRYLECFDRNQILILIYEDLRADTRSFVQKIYSFLDVDNTYISPNLNKKIHSTRIPKSQCIETAMVIMRILLRKIELYSLVEKLKKRGLSEKLKELNTQKNKTFRKMDARTRSRLNHIFANDKKMLSELLKRDLSFWN